MLEQKIILATHINESEKLKSLAIFNKKTINVHYFNAFELAKYLLQLSGIVITQKFISDEEVSAKLYSDIRKIKYFENSSFNDVLHLISSINDLRRYIVQDETKTIDDKLTTNVFVEKNNAVRDAYHLMLNLFNKEDLIDEVGIIRFALENIASFPRIAFSNYDDKYNLHIALLNKAAGKEVEREANCDIPADVKITSYTKAFGQTNEIENILAYIRDNKIPFDQCLIAAAETKDYSNVFNNYKDLLSIPLTIGTGTVLLETKPGKLFSIINEWLDNHNHTEFLKRIILDETFDLEKFSLAIGLPKDDFEAINQELEYPEAVSLDSIITTVGDMKMSFDQVSNNKKLKAYTDLLNTYVKEGFNEENTKRRQLELVFVNAFVNELNKGISSFVSNYAVSNDAKDENAKEKILKYLNYYDNYDIKYEDVKKAIFSQNVGRESIKEGTMYFTSISNAVSCLRKHLFVVGLSSNNFPGVSKENPILLDEDYEAFGVLKASNRNIVNNKETFARLLNEAKGCDSIHLSYAYYNSQSLKEQNASSVIFETYKKEYGDTKTVEDLKDEFVNDGKTKFKVVEFFTKDILPITNIGKVVSDNGRVEYSPLPENGTEVPKDLTDYAKRARGFSASAITDFAHCPYMFYLKTILKLEQPKRIDIYEVISPIDQGNLAHALLEKLDKSKHKTTQDFAKYAGERFDQYLIMHQPTNDVVAELAKKNFIDMMENAYDMSTPANVVLREKDIKADHSSGIRIHGKPDMVIQNSDGSLTVVDYKTGSTIKHNANDMSSLMQCAVYSYVLESIEINKHKRTVSAFEYWYLKHHKKIFSKDRDAFLQALDEILSELKTALQTGSFTPNLSYCKECFIKEICTKGKKK